ncbi:MAG: hypothetical protein LC797_16095 [Chloroflexi bacterium]|nr:hypothetical protein [Chloroflexota bacterium]
MIRAVGVGGWRGWLGLGVIALMLGLGYASLLSTILGQWVSEAATPVGVVLLSASCCLTILIWLLGAILR